LESAVTGERIAVEVKAQSDMEDYRQYVARYDSMVGFARFYFVTRSPIDAEVAHARDGTRTAAGITFWGSRTIAQRAAHTGLAQWLIDKAT
jgi:hypothetical protein